MEADVEEEDKTYKNLLRKFKISLLFTLPIFLIAMSEMIHNNPLMTCYALEILELGTVNSLNSCCILCRMDVF